MKPQPPTRVFVIADSDAEARKLVQTFNEFPGFAVAGFAISSSRRFDTQMADIVVVHTKDPIQAATSMPASSRTLYLRPERQARTRKLNNASAVLPSDASPAQIRAAAAALAAGLRVELSTVPHRDDGARIHGPGSPHRPRDWCSKSDCGRTDQS